MTVIIIQYTESTTDGDRPPVSKAWPPAVLVNLVEVVEQSNA